MAISKVVNHPDYTGSTSAGDDISLLKTRDQVTINQYVFPACLPAEDACYQDGSSSYVSGYGRLSESGSLASTLQYVEVPLVTSTECATTYGGIDSSKIFCAGPAAGGQDSCQGDSGGPLVVHAEQNVWYLYGVVSFGVGCARPDYYGAYTRVSNYAQWIYDTVSAKRDSPDSISYKFYSF